MVAVIDSGIGGLSVWIELRGRLLGGTLLYYADTAFCPYGTRSVDQIRDLTIDVAKRVIDRGAQVVVVACNTMTAAAIGALRERWRDVDFVGMEPAVKPAALSSKSGVVGILATKATLSGELYHNTRSQYASDVTVIETAGTGLVEFVEREAQDSPECEALLIHYIEPMLEARADTLVLGCTHYPFLSGAIERITGGRMEIINPASAVARRAMEFIEARADVKQEGGLVCEFDCSGSVQDLERLKTIAERLQR